MWFILCMKHVVNMYAKNSFFNNLLTSDPYTYLTPSLQSLHKIQQSSDTVSLLLLVFCIVIKYSDILLSWICEREGQAGCVLHGTMTLPLYMVSLTYPIWSPLLISLESYCVYMIHTRCCACGTRYYTLHVCSLRLHSIARFLHCLLQLNIITLCQLRCIVYAMY